MADKSIGKQGVKQILSPLIRRLGGGCSQKTGAAIPCRRLPARP